MLILGRQKGQSILIGDSIKVTVCGWKKLHGERMAILGIQAPPNVSIDREEIRAAKSKLITETIL